MPSVPHWWVSLWIPKRCLPNTCDCNLIWKKDLCRHNRGKNLEMRSSWNSMALHAMTRVLVRDEGQGKTAWGCSAKGCWQLPEARRQARNRSPSEPPEGNNPADTLILDFWTPELWENKFVLLSATRFVVICYSSPTERILALLGIAPSLTRDVARS